MPSPVTTIFSSLSTPISLKGHRFNKWILCWWVLGREHFCGVGLRGCYPSLNSQDSVEIFLSEFSPSCFSCFFFTSWNCDLHHSTIFSYQLPFSFHMLNLLPLTCAVSIRSLSTQVASWDEQLASTISRTCSYLIC